MIFNWFNAGEAARLGVELADQFSPKNAPGSPELRKESADALTKILQRADREVRILGLNFYKKAKFANSFKWRLLENGVEKEIADDVTQSLVLHLSGTRAKSVSGDSEAGSPDRLRPSDAKHLLAQGDRSIAQGAYEDAIIFYQDLITLNPRHAIAFNNLGTAFYKVGRYKEAEGCFHQALRIKSDFPDAYSNVGTALLLKGRYFEAENYLRHAVKLNPRFPEARINLGLALSFLSRLREAKSHFEKALKYEPRNADALFGMALVAKTEGSFDRASEMLDRALQVNPRMPRALASQASMRKMTTSDVAWLASAEEAVAGDLAPIDESELRFAIGKYYDDVEDFKRAFQNYKLGNDLLKPIAEPYDRAAYKSFVDRTITTFTPEKVRLVNGASDSVKPIFVVGMPRSGTSLTEQIISSHRSARGAGELEFWSHAVHEHEAIVKTGSLDDSVRAKLAGAYLRLLETKAGTAARVVDKAPVNSDYLGVIYSVFPNARIIYMQRDPIDTCLSCYFQKFVLSLNFTLDLSDLADYYRQHLRLITHWRTVLPPEAILDVPYEELVDDQERWTRKILDFLGLDWDPQVLDFHNTKRSVATASFWQVRQKIYKNSVRRWHNYEKYLGPLLPLKDLAH